MPVSGCVRRAGRCVLASCAAAAVVLAQVAPALAQGRPPPAATSSQPPASAPVLQALRVQEQPAAAVPAELRLGNGAAVSAGSLAIPPMAVTRSVPLTALRTTPMVTVPQGRLDFRPMLQNPRAPFNVAQRLRALPQLVTVRAETTTLDEGGPGLILRSTVRYELKTGACTIAARRVQVEQAGVSCSRRTEGAALDAAAADARSVRYIPPGQRGALVGRSRNQRAMQQADLEKNTAAVRQQLSQPGGRAALAQELGAAEVDRLAALPDDQLMAEIANSGETEVSEEVFIPAPTDLRVAAVSVLLQGRTRGRTPAAVSGPGLRSIGLARVGSPAQPAAAPAAPAQPQFQPGTQALQPRTFLTGFTLGKDYTWRMRIERTIKMCLVGCKRTYYAEAWAGFNYAIGLRFPMQAGGTYSYDGQGHATVAVNYAPINGSVDQYRATGLPESMVHDGKELVAQFHAEAGVAVKLPFFGSASVSLPTDQDFTTYLNGGLANGQVAPPVPGASGPSTEIPLSNLDLIGGLANFGVVGAKVYPNVRVGLSSTGMGMTLTDLQARGAPQPIASGQPVTLDVRGSGQGSRFALGDPTYNVQFLITPGLTASLFIDLGVWSTSWDNTLWLPQLEVALPPGGVDFSCHAQTVCSRTYTASPAGVSDIAAPASQFDASTPEGRLSAAIDKWGWDYDARNLQQCIDETCRFTIRFARYGTQLAERAKIGTVAEAALMSEIGALDGAGSVPSRAADDAIYDAKVRQNEKAQKAFYSSVQQVWTARCYDLDCAREVKSHVAAMLAWMNGAQAANPDGSVSDMRATLNALFVPKLQRAVDDSRQRTGGVRP